MLQQVEELEGTPRLHIVRLYCLCKGRNTCFSLTCCPTASDVDNDVDEARIRRHSEGLQDFVPLRRHVEVLDEGFAIDSDATSARLDVYLSRGFFAFAESPRLTC